MSPFINWYSAIKIKGNPYHSPISGIFLAVDGTRSAINIINIEKAKNTDKPNVTFSPESIGVQNVINVSNVNRIHGITIFQIKNFFFVRTISILNQFVYYPVCYHKSECLICL
ncbi:LOW QUALITY PROTEIN: neurotransmitter gated ion channel, putative [Schistosoma mansoni]|uniref:neurotransmitter gated ion channel, putative n=1 Tax=Schistosoma mansoni TaxID=6183 RepID=UPI00022C8160|nr:LOW QUALITY PROTEIN: neurotransmitter gated ion channel, putative [Schistosoma mansoni]|eukprot:XP_018646685.1 LOW QUALITY PROTEIN: neurotransmitter gated ion channel, putative [Schistosoma mansoni]